MAFPIAYRCPDGVAVVTGPPVPADTDRILLSTREGGAVAVDTGVFDVWTRAVSGRGDAGPLEPADADVLACLAEAGLLERVNLGVRAHGGGPVVSSLPEPPAGAAGRRVAAVIIVSGTSELMWLEECLRSVGHQSIACCDVVVVDNWSQAGLTEWMAARQLPGRVVPTRKRLSLSAALNVGVAATSADHYLLMNADVRLDPDALRHLLAGSGPRVAAVAPKLRFWWAPAFLNGLGNRVPPHGWGTDNAIGQLDLGQFDGWRTVPSGCLAVLLIHAAAWSDVGPLDSGYPGYYEDSDWCYRARACGWQVAAAPAAVAYHVFGASWAVDERDLLPHAKLERALAGRWRFTLKIATGRRLKHWVMALAMEDGRNIVAAVRERSWPGLKVYGRAAWRIVTKGPSMWRGRRRIQRQRRVSDDALFLEEAGMPQPMLWRNLPELTLPAVRDYYGPLMRQGVCRRIPEMS